MGRLRLSTRSLCTWAESDWWQQILARTDKRTSGQFVVIDAMGVSGLAKQVETVDASLIAYDEHRCLFATRIVENCDATTSREIAFSHRREFEWQPRRSWSGVIEA